MSVCTWWPVILAVGMVNYWVGMYVGRRLERRKLEQVLKNIKARRTDV